MCRKKPIESRGARARSIAGTSMRWKSCTQTRESGAQCARIVVGEALVHLDVALPTPRA